MVLNVKMSDEWRDVKGERIIIIAIHCTEYRP